MTWDVQEIFLTTAGGIVYLTPLYVLLRIWYDEIQEEKQERRQQQQNKKAS
jgi:hypothetical protein